MWRRRATIYGVPGAPSQEATDMLPRSSRGWVRSHSGCAGSAAPLPLPEVVANALRQQHKRALELRLAAGPARTRARLPQRGRHTPRAAVRGTRVGSPPPADRDAVARRARPPSRVRPIACCAGRSSACGDGAHATQPVQPRHGDLQTRRARFGAGSGAGNRPCARFLAHLVVTLVVKRENRPGWLSEAVPFFAS